MLLTKFFFRRCIYTNKLVGLTWGDINSGEVGPGAYSLFHIISILLTVAVCVILAMTLARRHRASTDRAVISALALILVGCEVFKQLFWYEFYGYYRFEIFPFQFCSVPIYVSVFAALIPSERIRDKCYRFLAFYGIVGGLAVMIAPHAVLYTYFIPMSIHAMLWHAILIIMGIYLIASRGYGRRISELRAPALMLLVFVIIAIIGNILVYKLHLSTPDCMPGDKLSMFYISPYYPTELPLLGAVQELSYPLFVLCYLFIFNLFAFTVWGTARFFHKALLRKKA